MAKKYTKTATAVKAAAATASKVIIRQPEEHVITLEIEGTASVIQNNFSQKAIEQMLRKQMGITQGREVKKPRDCIEQAKIKNVDGHICIPPEAFKSGMITAHSDTKPSKKALWIALFVKGGSVPITYEMMIPRMDMVRLAGIGRTPDVRFRPEFTNWKARLQIIFDPNLLKVQSVVDLLNRAGRVGVGEWRPERKGTFGTYRVCRNITSPEEITEVETLCGSPRIRPVIPEWAMDAEIDVDLLRRIAKGEEDENTPDPSQVESEVLNENELDEDADSVVSKRTNRRKAS